MKMPTTAAQLPLNPLAIPIREDADGSLRVGNTRVVLELVLEAFRDGGSPEEIVQAFSTLVLSDVYALATWYLRNRDAADAWLDECDSESEELRRNMDMTRGMSREIRERLLARSRAGSRLC